MRISKNSILRDAAFLRVWLAVTVSSFGSSITNVGLALLAATRLGATPVEMGMLGAAFTTPFVVLGPLIGVYADRMHRRRILIAADLIRATVLAAMPLLLLRGWLDMNMLYVLAVALGIGDTWFDVAYGSYLPLVIGRERLVEGHSKLQISQSAAEVAGPGVSGLVIQAIGIQIGLLIDAASFVFSALFIHSISSEEPAPDPRGTAKASSVWRDLKDGVVFLFGQSLLRGLTIRLAIWQFTSSGVLAMLMLFVTKYLRLEAAQIGLLLSAIGVGVFAGANLAERISKQLGVGYTIALANLGGAFALLAVPLSPKLHAGAVVLLAIALFVYGFCQINYYINNASLRQAITPDGMLGRVGAGSRTVALTMHGLGAAATGMLGAQIGLAPALLVIGVAAVLLAAIGLFQGALQATGILPPKVELNATEGVQ